MLIYALFAFQLAGFGLVLYLMLRMYLTLRQDGGAAVDAGSGAATTAAAQRNLTEMMAELRRTAEQINRDLAARSSQLQRQLDDAERKIAVLEEALRHAAVPPPAIPEPAASRPAAPPRDTTAVVPAEPGETSTDFRPIDLREAGKYQQILRLADEGLSALEIARRTQMGREEVELVLGLRNEGKTA